MNYVEEKIKEEVMDDGDWGKEDRSLERFHPSQAGLCERQIFLRKINAKTFDYHVKGILQLGTIIHDWVQKIEDVLTKYHIEKGVRFDIPESHLYFRGNADLVAKDGSEVIDLKSINGFNWVEGSPMKSHTIQLMVYMKALGISEGKIVYVDKNTLKTLSHDVKIDEDELKEVYAKIERVYQALKKWDSEGKFNKIPFDKCGCFFCRQEKLKPEFEKLIDDAKVN